MSLHGRISTLVSLRGRLLRSRRTPRNHSQVALAHDYVQAIALAVVEVVYPDCKEACRSR